MARLGTTHVFQRAGGAFQAIAGLARVARALGCGAPVASKILPAAALLLGSGRLLLRPTSAASGRSGLSGQEVAFLAAVQLSCADFLLDLTLDHATRKAARAAFPPTDTIRWLEAVTEVVRSLPVEAGTAEAGMGQGVQASTLGCYASMCATLLDHGDTPATCAFPLVQAAVRRDAGLQRNIIEMLLHRCLPAAAAEVVGGKIDPGNRLQGWCALHSAMVALDMDCLEAGVRQQAARQQAARQGRAEQLLGELPTACPKGLDELDFRAVWVAAMRLLLDALRRDGGSGNHPGPLLVPPQVAARVALRHLPRLAQVAAALQGAARANSEVLFNVTLDRLLQLQLADRDSWGSVGGSADVQLLLASACAGVQLNSLLLERGRQEGESRECLGARAVLAVTCHKLWCWSASLATKVVVDRLSSWSSSSSGDGPCDEACELAAVAAPVARRLLVGTCRSFHFFVAMEQDTTEFLEAAQHSVHRTTGLVAALQDVILKDGSCKARAREEAERHRTAAFAACWEVMRVFAVASSPPEQVAQQQPDCMRSWVLQLAWLAANGPDCLALARPELLQLIVATAKCALTSPAVSSEHRINLSISLVSWAALEQSHILLASLLTGGVMADVLALPDRLGLLARIPLEDVVSMCSLLLRGTHALTLRAQECALSDDSPAGRALSQWLEALPPQPLDAFPYTDPALPVLHKKHAVLASMTASLPTSVALAERLQQYWAEGGQAGDVRPAVRLAQAAAARSCANLGCPSVVCGGGPDAGQGVGCKKCQACMTSYYCGAACQRLDWKRGGHKGVCRELGEAGQRERQARQEEREQRRHERQQQATA